MIHQIAFASSGLQGALRTCSYFNFLCQVSFSLEASADWILGHTWEQSTGYRFTGETVYL